MAQNSNRSCRSPLGFTHRRGRGRNVIDVLKPLWARRPDAASRLSGRIEATLDFAAANRWRSGPNPAQWRGNLAHVFPKRPAHQRSHHSALPHAELPGFIAQLRKMESTAARALEFIILTAAYSPRRGRPRRQMPDGPRLILTRRFGPCPPAEPSRAQNTACRLRRGRLRLSPRWPRSELTISSSAVADLAASYLAGLRIPSPRVPA